MRRDEGKRSQSTSGPLRLGVLISGGGRTLRNLHEHIEAGDLAAQIACVVSSRASVAGVKQARKLRLNVQVVSRKGLPDPEFHDCIAAVLNEADVDLVCMAGFTTLWRIPKDFEGRVINIHPALLPDFGGQGFYGDRVHEAVLAAGRKVSGCTVHYCDNEYDHGSIILRREVPVLPNDTPEFLAARVFEQECLAYPEAIRLHTRM